MPKVNLTSDFAKEIAKSLGMADKWVDEWFEINEDKQGYFTAKLKPKKFLEKDQFRTVCALVRDLGGEGYLQGMKMWKVPSSFAKKTQTNTTSTPSPTDARSKSESIPETKVEAEGVQSSDEYFIAKSVQQIGYLYPILKDAHGNVIDGYHRLNIDPNWPVKKVEEVTDPVQLAIARLIANVCRRDIPAEEKTEWLRQIATLTGWSPKEIAANLPVSYTWVMKYLPDEFKERPGAGPSEYPVTRRVTQPQFISCALCGVATNQPVHLSGKFYCENCAKKIVAPSPLKPAAPSQPSEPSTEARRAAQPELAATTPPLTQSEPSAKLALEETELIQCEHCHVHSSDCKPWRGHNLCSKCFEEAESNPKKYEAYFDFSKTKPVVKPETWVKYFRYHADSIGALRSGKTCAVCKREIQLGTGIYYDGCLIHKDCLDSFREARMKPQVSAFEVKFDVEAAKAGLPFGESHMPVCVRETVPDKTYQLPKGVLHVFFDGKTVHEGHEDRDEALRDVLRKRGETVLSITYERVTEEALQSAVEQVRAELLRLGWTPKQQQEA